MPGQLYEPPDPSTMETRLRHADRPGEHLWIMTAGWLIAAPSSAGDPAVLKFMDRENLVILAGPGCYKCERPYSAKVAAGRCPGVLDL